MTSRVHTSVPAMKEWIAKAKQSGRYFVEFKADNYPGPLSDLAECLTIAGAMSVQEAPLFHSVIVQLRKEPDWRPIHVKK